MLIPALATCLFACRDHRRIRSAPEPPLGADMTAPPLDQLAKSWDPATVTFLRNPASSEKGDHESLAAEPAPVATERRFSYNWLRGCGVYEFITPARLRGCVFKTAFVPLVDRHFEKHC